MLLVHCLYRKRARDERGGNNSGGDDDDDNIKMNCEEIYCNAWESARKNFYVCILEIETV